MASHNTGSRNIQYTEKCSKCGPKITPQGLKRHEAVWDDQREIALLQQELQEGEERRLLDMFKCPRLGEFQYQNTYPDRHLVLFVHSNKQQPHSDLHQPPHIVCC